MRGFLIAMASLAFIGGLGQGGTAPIERPKPVVVQPIGIDPTVLPPVECAPVEAKESPSIFDSLTAIGVSSPTVILVSASWCEPCQRWKAGPMPAELAAKGWKLIPIDVTDPQWAHIKVRMYPTYRIFDGTKWSQVEGVLTGAKMKSAINPGPVRRVMQNAVSSVRTVPDQYRARWANFDGKSRMQHAIEDHGIDVRGKSEAQVLREMDAYHDRYGGGHSVRHSNVVQSGGCPGGSCPPQRRSFFARR